MSRHPAALSEPARATLEALDRLAQSRERLRNALAESGEGPSANRQTPGTANPAGQGHAPRRGHSVPPGRPASVLRWPSWLGSLVATPAGSLLLELTQLWWARQPARVGVQLAGDAAALVLAPIAREHPVRLVLGAAAAGAVLVALRPWRWLGRSAITPALLMGLLPQLLNQMRDLRSQSQ